MSSDNTSVVTVSPAMPAHLQDKMARYMEARQEQAVDQNETGFAARKWLNWVSNRSEVVANGDGKAGQLQLKLGDDPQMHEMVAAFGLDIIGTTSGWAKANPTPHRWGVSRNSDDRDAFGIFYCGSIDGVHPDPYYNGRTLTHPGFTGEGDFMDVKAGYKGDATKTIARKVVVDSSRTCKHQCSLWDFTRYQGGEPVGRIYCNQVPRIVFNVVGGFTGGKPTNMYDEVLMDVAGMNAGNMVFPGDTRKSLHEKVGVRSIKSTLFPSENVDPMIELTGVLPDAMDQAVVIILPYIVTTAHFKYVNKNSSEEETVYVPVVINPVDHMEPGGDISSEIGKVAIAATTIRQPHKDDRKRYTEAAYAMLFNSAVGIGNSPADEAYGQVMDRVLEYAEKIEVSDGLKMPRGRVEYLTPTTADDADSESTPVTSSASSDDIVVTPADDITIEIAPADFQTVDDKPAVDFAALAAARKATKEAEEVEEVAEASVKLDAELEEEVAAKSFSIPAMPDALDEWAEDDVED